MRPWKKRYIKANMKYIIEIVVFCISLIYIDCAKRPQVTLKEFDIKTPEGLFNEGKYYLKNKNFEYALRSFYTLVEDFPTDSLADDAQFLIAEILANPKNPNFNIREAISEYENLIKSHSESPLVPKAKKQLAKLQKLNESNQKR